MRKQITIISILLSILVLCSGFLASADSSQQIVLTLEEAKLRALENNLEYNQQNSSINDSLESYYDTEENNEKSYSSAAKGFYEYFMKPVNLETSLQSAINNVKTARLKKESLKTASDQNVTKAFINIKKAQYKLEDAKYNASAKLKDYETAKIKYDLELVKKTELKQAENAYTAAAEAETAALKSLQQEFMTLNRYLGRELTDYNLQLVIDLKVIDLDSIDLDKVRKDYISNKESLYALELKTELAKKKYDTTKERYDEFVVKLKVQNSRDEMEEAFDDAVREYESARKAFEDATIDLNMSLNTSFEALEAAIVSITALEEDIEMCKEEEKVAEMQYEMELISKSSMDKAQIELSSLNNKLKTNIADLNLQYSNLLMYSK